MIPHFLEENENLHEIINQYIPTDRLILMSQLIDGIKGNYSAVYEDFEQNIYDALSEAVDKLKKYNALKIIFPQYTYHPETILTGFSRFCQDYAFAYEIIPNVDVIDPQRGDVYICLMEADLITLIKKTLKEKLKVGEDVGIISYNEIPIKEIILNGITTISADFDIMGKKAAKLILTKQTEHYSVPFYLTLRDSL